MTNYTLVRNGSKNEISTKASLLTDGLASCGDETYSGVQKLVPLGDNYMAATGSSDIISHVAKKSSTGISSEITDSLALAKKARKILNDETNLSKKEGYEFLFLDPKDGIRAHTTGYRILTPQEVEGQLYFGRGSGAQYVEKAMRRDIKKGNLILSDDMSLADIALILFDAGIEAAKSAGVNTEFQFAFIDGDKTGTLYNPNIQMGIVPKDYARARKQDSEFVIDPKKKQEKDKLYYDVVNRLNELYSISCHRGVATQEKVKKGNVTSRKEARLIRLFNERKNDIETILQEKVLGHKIA